LKRQNIEKCRKLRREETEAEKKLWTVLRDRQLAGVKFRRQFSIDRYILDFYCPEHRVGIEADGGQHYGIRARQRDELRTKELAKVGVQIIRFNDHEILTNIEGVCEIIQRAIEMKRSNPPHLYPLPSGGEEGGGKALLFKQGGKKWN
jgi:very-short-patch-repair endonuclease